MPHQDFLLQGKFASSSVLLFLGSPLIRLCGYLHIRVLEPHTEKLDYLWSSLHGCARLGKQTKITFASLRPTPVTGTKSHNLHGTQFVTRACVDQTTQRPLRPLASTSLAAKSCSFACVPVGAASPFSQTRAHKGLN